VLLSLPQAVSQRFRAERDVVLLPGLAGLNRANTITQLSLEQLQHVDQLVD
jgi:hypothetical protein